MPDNVLSFRSRPRPSGPAARRVLCTYKTDGRARCGRPASHAFALHSSAPDVMPGQSGFACPACAEVIPARYVAMRAEVTQLTAGVLATLADAVPRCASLPCSAAVGSWGSVCAACAAALVSIGEALDVPITVTPAGDVRGAS